MSEFTSSTTLSRLRRLAGLAAVCLSPFALSAHAEVAQPNGDWREEVEEFRVQSLGGPIRIQRDYVFDHWQINARWAPLAFELDLLDNSIKRITRNDASFERQGEAWAFDKRALIQKKTVTFLSPGSAQGSAPASLAGHTPAETLGGGAALQSSAGYRWLNREGEWIDYDGQGRAVAYGERNQIATFLEYGSGANAERIVAIRDHFGRTLITYTYDANGNVKQIDDVPANTATPTAPVRSLKLTWNGNLLTQSTDVLGHVTQYTYTADAKPKLTSETDAEQRIRTITYGPTGRIQKVHEPDGGEVTWQYNYDKLKRTFYLRRDGPATAAGTPVDEVWTDADGREIRHDINGKTQKSLLQDSANRTQTSTDGRGLNTVVSLDDYDNPIKTVYADGSQSSASYSPVHGGITASINEFGVKTQYDYDSLGNLIKTTEAVGLPEQRITELTRDGFGQIISETKKGGTVNLPDNSPLTIADATTLTEFDSWGNAIRVTDAESNSSTFTRDRLGNIASLIDPAGKTWNSSYDAKGRLVSRSDPLAHGTTLTYDNTDRPKTLTDAMTHVTSYGYDAAGRLNQQTDPLDHSVSRTYDKLGRLLTDIDEAGNPRQTLAYDLDGRLLTSTDANGNATTYRYTEGLALPTAIQYPTFTRQYSFDARSRNTETRDLITDNATTPPTPVTLISRQDYDKAGNLIKITDKNGKLTQLDYDAHHRLVKVTDPASGITRYTYDPRDNLLAVTDPNGNTTRYAYDRNNRRISETRPLGGVTQYQYDSRGNLTQVQDPKGNVIQYGYDDARRRVGESYLAPNASTASRVINYSYNAADALTGYTDTRIDQTGGQLASSATYTLDALNRKTGEALTYGTANNGSTLAGPGANHPYTLATDWAAIGKKAKQVWPDSTEVSYQWDAAQNLNTITLPGNLQISVQQRNWNLPTTTLLPGGSQKQATYDSLLRPTRIKTLSPGGAPLQETQLRYDPESNVTQKDTDYGSHSYGYDNLYRLTQASNPTLPSEGYSYDAVGNRLTDSRTGTNPWTYDADNKLTQAYSQTAAAAINNTWDTNGSLTQLASSDASPTHNQQYRYDEANRLVEVKDANGNPIASYLYDPFGRRIRKTTTQGSTDFLYADEGLIAEADPTGTISKRYGWNPEGLWSTDPLFVSGRRTGADPASPLESFYSLNDHLGTSQKLIDQSGQVVWEARATAFGETQIQPGSQLENNLRFAGQYFDNETNTHYNFFRDYDPTGGRYRERDPLGLEAGPNIYTYVQGNPIAYMDPRGLLTPEEALVHYQDGTETSMRMSFDEINTDSVRPSTFSKVKQALSTASGKQKISTVDKKPCCKPETLTIDDRKPFTTFGHQFLLLGNITLRLQGSIKIDAKCNWTFVGTLKSFDDYYDFNMSNHRGAFAEWLTKLGRESKGKPFWIEIRGQKAISESGQL